MNYYELFIQNGEELYYLILICLLIGLILYILWRWRHPKASFPLYVCLDGHIVKSRGEWMIDAALQYLNIPHEYEPYVRINGKVIRPDFSLGNGIYIEFWGLHSKRYLKRKKMKQRLYKQARCHLINVESQDLQNIVVFIKRKVSCLCH
mgnify:CR=1 FL=1